MFSNPYGAGGQPPGPGWVGGNDSNAGYGTASPWPTFGGGFKYPKQHRVLNVLALAIGVLVPTAIFAAVFSLMSFFTRFRSAGLAYGLCLCLLVVVAVFGYLAIHAVRKKFESLWFAFLFLSSLWAWVLGFLLGDIHFTGDMSLYYDLSSLHTYEHVDPREYRGQQLMDAGQIEFIYGSRIDVRRSMGFKDTSTYCVAPVTFGDIPLTTYDFWAVGVDCCSGHQADFHCGKDFNSRWASSGLRLINDRQQPMFQLAVEQAEAMFHIKAAHPIFLDWMEDTQAELDRRWGSGMNIFVAAVVAFLVFQTIFAIAVGVVEWRRLGNPYSWNVQMPWWDPVYGQ